MNNKTQNSFLNQSRPFALKESVQIIDSKSESEIWREFDLGDEKAFNYLFRVYTPLLMRYGCQLTHDQGLVKDCIQNLFIRLRKMRGKLEKVAKVKSYLYKSLQRDIFKQIHKSSNEISLENENLFLIELSFESRLIDYETDSQHREQLNVALKFLTERQRQALLLLYVEGFSYKEVAELMELKDAKYARKLVYRALGILRSSFKSKSGS
ncbi:RNA polymerase sigma factor [Algoriphagus zhangzhouensis]|uniref:RNA polymerase sigma-70 factor, ECF subfamily n=1 Tax=Algoriphagus zhangzhouensis TaxID=1073327 RepID=A0A1M7Z7U5_9BACT|nr:RNA polymerase sigma factor [Algoriphagus zhangzhouensis]TDY49481.1 RNA polymerase sigma-70 factor (ECF subfamily) [Algoriphagus zhangzhouensis]SHO61007.1 RNA polymerase sigma-70 factor, ECF subfamily [Algoriphagus zhangzhouensis]